MPNGNILTTGFGVHEIDRMGALVETKITGFQARFIEFVGGEPAEPPVVEIPTVGVTGAGLMVMIILTCAVAVLRRRATSGAS